MKILNKLIEDKKRNEENVISYENTPKDNIVKQTNKYGVTDIYTKDSNLLLRTDYGKSYLDKVYTKDHKLIYSKEYNGDGETKEDFIYAVRLILTGNHEADNEDLQEEVCDYLDEIHYYIPEYVYYRFDEYSDYLYKEPDDVIYDIYKYLLKHNTYVYDYDDPDGTAAILYNEKEDAKYYYQASCINKSYCPNIKNYI